MRTTRRAFSNSKHDTSVRGPGRAGEGPRGQGGFFGEGGVVYEKGVLGWGGGEIYIKYVHIPEGVM